MRRGQCSVGEVLGAVNLGNGDVEGQRIPLCGREVVVGALQTELFCCLGQGCVDCNWDGSDWQGGGRSRIPSQGCRLADTGDCLGNFAAGKLAIGSVLNGNQISDGQGGGLAGSVDSVLLVGLSGYRLAREHIRSIAVVSNRDFYDLTSRRKVSGGVTLTGDIVLARTHCRTAVGVDFPVAAGQICKVSDASRVVDS